MSRRLAISFSGGETSAYMTLMVLSKYKHLYDEIIITFMNTSQEREDCLVFVDKCDRELFQPLGHSVVWLEALTYHGIRKRCGATITSFTNAYRDGSKFEQVIQKYGVPNKAYPHCNRELKLSPFSSYLEDIGWMIGSYDIAIGIRADEIDRIVKNHKEKRIVYPLIQWEPTTKTNVNTFFRNQPFRLGTKGYQNNCKWCWKKSLRKLYTLAIEDPEMFRFPYEMEQKYGELRGDRRVFFRENKNTVDIVWGAISTDFTPAEDDSIVYDEELDVGGACDGGESCEMFSQDDDNA